MAFEGMSLERAIREIKSALGKNVHYDGTADSYVMGNLGVGTAPEERFHAIATDDLAGLFDYLSSDTVNKRNVVKVRHITSGDMDDEFGAALAFYHMDDAEVDNLVGSVGTRRNGADNTAYIEIAVPLAGVFERVAKFYPDLVTFSKFVRAATSLYRRYYHMPLAAFNPGATGATWTPPDANTVGGYKLDAATEILYLAADIHADWDGASDITVEVKFEINTASAENDTVDLKLVCYYKGEGDTTTKTQTLEVATNVGDGGANAQYTKFEMDFTINWDETDNVVEVGDDFHFILNLETDTSEVDNIIINGAALYYQTAHIGIESGDT